MKLHLSTTFAGVSRGTRSGGGTKAAVGGGTRTGVPADPGENTSCCLADGRVGVIIVYLDTILQVVLGLEVVRRLQWVEAQGAFPFLLLMCMRK